MLQIAEAYRSNGNYLALGGELISLTVLPKNIVNRRSKFVLTRLLIEGVIMPTAIIPVMIAPSKPL